MSFLSAEDKNFDEFCEQVLKYLQLKEEIEYGLRKVTHFTLTYFLFVFFLNLFYHFLKTSLNFSISFQSISVSKQYTI